MDDKIKIRLKQILENSIGDECIFIEKNDESSDGNVFIINGKANKYVAKVYDDVKHVESMINLHNMVSKSINIPKILYSDLLDKNDSEDCFYIVIYSFINGKPVNKTMKDGKVDNDLIRKIAKEIQKMHKVSLDENLFGLPELPFDTINKRKTMLHFDLTKSNVFLDDDNISIIDFDDAMYGSAIYDISILISTFFFSKSRGIDIAGMNEFLDAYYGDDIELKNEEVQSIKDCSIQWIDYLITNNKLPESLIESFKTKRVLISSSL